MPDKTRLLQQDVKPIATTEEAVRVLLRHAGEDPQRQGLLKTPRRVVESLEFLTAGSQMNLQEIINEAIFDVEADEMVIVRDIELYSMCEHHMLPFFGKAHVAYLPKKKVIGLSKIPRIVDMYARRLQVQERLTNEIATALHSVLDTKGVAVVIEARHFCMMMRGVQKQNSAAVTSCMLGGFKSQDKTRMEFLRLIESRSI